MSQWIGCSVSIHCGKTLGTYQGQILEATPDYITLVKAFRNGLPYPRSEVTLKAFDIEDLRLIDVEPINSSSTPGRSTVTVAKPVAKRMNRSMSVPETVVTNKITTSTPITKPKVLNIEAPKPQTLPLVPEIVAHNSNNTPNAKKEKPPRSRYTKGWKDEACFGTPLDHLLQKDFDFEKNLALFDKQAIWEELNASQKPDVVRQTDKRHQLKYRHDENIISSLPTVFREIEVPAPDMREYVTDSGLVVPSVTLALRSQLWIEASKHGFNWERKTELMGRAATEISLQLLGGGHRLNPHNTHQAPTVVILCGPHNQGIIGLNTARQLASHGVNTIVYLHGQNSSTFFRCELNLYKLTKQKIATRTVEFPTTVDLIILALCDDSDNPIAVPHLAEWTNQNRAPVLALDPPAIGTPGFVTKFSIVPVLPLSYSPDNGKLYLCNLGLPLRIFTELGIKYKSPFGPKFVIPLHPNDT